MRTLGTTPISIWSRSQTLPTNLWNESPRLKSILPLVEVSKSDPFALTTVVNLLAPPSTLSSRKKALNTNLPFHTPVSKTVLSNVPIVPLKKRQGVYSLEAALHHHYGLIRYPVLSIFSTDYQPLAKTTSFRSAYGITLLPKLLVLNNFVFSAVLHTPPSLLHCVTGRMYPQPA